MSAEAFLDTNILIYAASRRQADAPKRKIAIDLIGRIEFATSSQVLAEFYVTVRKGDRPMSALDALTWIEQLENQPCVPVDTLLVKRGIEISERYRISYWDGAIIAAAEVAGASTLYTEDLNDGQNYGEVRVANPFAEGR